MQRTILGLLVFLLTVPLFAQSNWARRVGAWSNDAFNDLVVDGAGNNYVTGEFGGLFTYEGTVLSSQGSLDIMVAKFDANGQLLWINGFGGTGFDRGISLALGPNGELAVTGQFMGSISLGTQTLVSAGGTQDMFVMRLDPIDGSVIWAAQGGGPDGVDQPNGISIGPNGDVAVTGEFRGNAIFGSTTLTSIDDPDTGLPSVDVFVVSYSVNGVQAWLKQGASERADRGIDLVHDPIGNVYVTGQFSDTITFDVTHNNDLFSAVFIIKFDQAGNEQWFRVMGGGIYQQVFDMDLVAGTSLMLTGDVQGTVIFQDTTPDLFTAAEARSSFLVEVDLNGEFMRQTTWGSDNVVNTRSMAVIGTEVMVLGRFQCQFTGFSALYDTGTWLATGQHDLYIASFDLDSLYLKGAQQFGGQKNKVPGAIAGSLDGEPVFCGSFDRVLIFPKDNVPWSTTPTVNLLYSPSVPSTYCVDTDYGRYLGLRGGGLLDGFIARGYVASREPYDYFIRSGANCVRPQLDVAIMVSGIGVTGSDTLFACGSAVLSVLTNTAYSPDTSVYHTAPDLEFLWNNGVDSTEIHIYQSGWVGVTITSEAGCWQRMDSAYIVVDPIPARPLISDDVVVNTNASSAANFTVCEPDQPWLWATGIATGNTIQWTGPPGVFLNDSIHASISGLYTAQVTSPAGCVQINTVFVTIVPSGSLPPLTAEFDLGFPQDTDMNDTILVCSNVTVGALVSISLSLNGLPTSLPYGVRVLVSCNGGTWGDQTNAYPLVGCNIPYTAEGWYTMAMGIAFTNAPCGTDTLFFELSGQIYIVPYPVTYPTAIITGPSFICPGDTATLQLQCTACEIINWQGANIAANYTDSLWVDGPGNYIVNVTHADTNGCVTSMNESHNVVWNLQPLLNVLPTDGIICPDSIALIFTETLGSAYQWYGPLGPLSVDNDTIATTQQGFYYVEMVDQTGCFIVSDPVLVTDYATPFLNVLPDNVLCGPDETATLQVITTSTASLQWWSPLTGNGLQQVVTQPGIYTCSVQACGIVTDVSVEIFGNNAIAEIEQTGPFVICPDDTLLLTATPGMTAYYWLPGTVVSNTLTVTEGGTYTLVALDEHGCEAELEIIVTEIPWSQALVVSDTTICIGTPLILNVPGSGTITWYSDQLLTLPVGTGNMIDLGIPQTSFSVFAQQVENACSSSAHVVHVNVLSYPLFPVITGPDSTCVGELTTLSIPTEQGVIYTWSTPQGPFSGPVLTIPSIGLEHAGTYSAEADNGTCNTPGTVFTLTVFVPELLQLAPDTMICPGGIAVYGLPNGFTDPLWNDGSTANDYTTSTNGALIVTATDTNGCSVTGTANVTVFQFPQPLTGLPVNICLGDDATMVALGSGELTWYADSALIQYLDTGGTHYVTQPSDSSVFYVSQSEWQCMSNTVAIPLNVTPVPIDVGIEATQPVCLGAPLTVHISGGPTLNGTWETPLGPATDAVLYYEQASLQNSGTYTAVPSYGPCSGDTISITVNVIVPEVLFIGNDTTFCDGGEFYIALPSGFTDPHWSTNSTANYIVVQNSGVYSVTAIDGNGCTVFDEVELVKVDCPTIIPNVFTPNGDGTNDVFTLDPATFLSAALLVYNRWGQLVWEGDPSRTGFRGLHADNNEPLSDGTYFYLLHLVRTGGREQDIQGYFTILR